MVKKLQKGAAKKTPGAQLSGSVKDSAQQIWQAGLGAFTRAQAEGSKAFEALVKEGVHIQRKTQTVAEEKISEATAKMSNMATDLTSKASGQWDKLNDVEELAVPPDLAGALKKNRLAAGHFEAFPRSVKRAILEWILGAKKPETRAARIAETVSKAEKNIRANQWRQ